jgi:hypothetical protein
LLFSHGYRTFFCSGEEVCIYIHRFVYMYIYLHTPWEKPGTKVRNHTKSESERKENCAMGPGKPCKATQKHRVNVGQSVQIRQAGLD